MTAYLASLKARLTVWYARHFYTYAEAKGWLTTNFLALVGGLGTLWAAMPDDAKSTIVQAVLAGFKIPASWTVVAIALVALVLRLKKQAPKDPAETAGE